MMNQDALGSDNDIVMAKDADAALEALADAKITCFVTVDEDEKTFTLYKNTLNNTEASVVEAMMATYVARYNAVMQIVKVNPMALAELDMEKPAGDYTAMVALGQENNIKSMDYYGIAMVVLFVMYGFLQSYSNVIEERKTGTGNRTLVSPLQKATFFAGKMGGQLLTLMIQLGAVALFSAVVFGVSWLVFSTEGAGMTLGHIVIVLSAFFGGSYVPLSQLGDLGVIGKFFSVIWWVQTGIINYIYLGETATLFKAILVCLSVTAVMFAISIFKLGKTEGLANV